MFGGPAKQYSRFGIHSSKRKLKKIYKEKNGSLAYLKSKIILRKTLICFGIIRINGIFLAGTCKIEFKTICKNREKKKGNDEKKKVKF